MSSDRRTQKIRVYRVARVVLRDPFPVVAQWASPTGAASNMYPQKRHLLCHIARPCSPDS